MHILKFFFLSVICTHLVYGSSESRFEGFFKDHANIKLHLISLFLTYNPTILAYCDNINAREQCELQWPKGVFCQSGTTAQAGNCNFLWVDAEGNELSILKQHCMNPELKVVYTSTSFKQRLSRYPKLKKYLESQGFVLLSHWYLEGNKGNAIFLKKDIFNLAMKSWNYSPVGNIHSVPIENSVGIEHFFKKVESKKDICHLEEIDFIYLINLDERPEKFTLVNAELNRHGIYPYRFSAVNGWKLPLSTIRQVGVPFSNQMTKGEFMGSVYKEIGCDECVSNEPIDKEGEIYFSLSLRRGAIGCILSHLSVLQDAYDSGYKTIWVMEDDVEVLKDIKSIPQLIRKLSLLDPDWDVLYTDPDTKDFKGCYVLCRSIAARPNFDIQPLSDFRKCFYPINSELSRTGMRYGTYSMILRRPGIKKILDYFKSYHIFLPYDMDIWNTPGLKMYCPHQAIVSHRPGSITDNGRPNYDSKNVYNYR